jgi:hypothetical protein
MAFSPARRSSLIFGLLPAPTGEFSGGDLRQLLGLYWFDYQVPTDPTTHIKAAPHTLFPLVLARVVAKGVFTASQVDLGLKLEPQPVISGSEFLRFDPGDMPFDEDMLTGAGRAASVCRMRGQIRIYMRAHKDSNEVDTKTLNRLYQKAFLVADALQLWHPRDGDGNLATIEPIRLGGFSRPKRYNIDPKGWIYMASTVEIAMELPFTDADEETCS